MDVAFWQFGDIFKNIIGDKMEKFFMLKGSNLKGDDYSRKVAIFTIEFEFEQTTESLNTLLNNQAKITDKIEEKINKYFDKLLKEQNES